MAFLATNFFPADGSKTFWDFAFAGVSPDSNSGTTPYLFPEDVKALELYTDSLGNAQAVTRIVTINPSQPNRANIYGPAIAAGRQVKIFRQTEIRFPLVDYRDRQSVSELDLDLANRQAIFIAQETKDAATNLSVDAMDNFDIKGRRLTNVGDGVNDGDAVNMRQFNRSVRGPATEGALQPMTGWADRVGKFLTFDGAGNPVASILSSETAAGLQAALADPTRGARMVGSGITVVADNNGLAGLSVSNPSQYAVTLGSTVIDNGGGGLWRFVPGNLSASVSSDPKRGLFLAPASAPSGASGAWVRVVNGQAPLPQWWGDNASQFFASSLKQGVSMKKNRAGANSDQWVMFFGDSHSWGQGSTECDKWELAGNVSTYSANLHTKGFVKRLRDDIVARRGFHTFTYGAVSPKYQQVVKTGFYGEDWQARAAKDPVALMPLLPVVGEMTAALSPLQAANTTVNTAINWYTPAARIAPYTNVFREKLATGLFGSQLLTLRKETATNFTPAGKHEFVETEVNHLNAGSGEGFTAAKTAGGGIIAERNDTNGEVYISTAHTQLPVWATAGNNVLIPGYGLVNIVTILSITGGIVLKLTEVGGAALPATFMRCITDRMRLYHPAYAQRAVFRVPLQGQCRAIYVAVRHKVGGGVLNGYFVDNISTGGATDPALQGGDPILTANTWEWAGLGSGVSVLKCMPDGSLTPSSYAGFLTDRFFINTEALNVGLVEEVVYRIDFGNAQSGDFFLELATGSDVEIRGVVADNNKIVNCAMGGRSVGQWIGLGDEDRVGQILQHVPVRPSHVVTQVPFVNEYLQQTPIAQFRTNLNTFITRLGSHLPDSNNFNNPGTDFLFFTSLRQGDVGFENAVSNPLTYDMYVAAAKEVCQARGCVFIDSEAALFAKVRSGYVDFPRLYHDNLHPSDYANELIYREVQQHLAQLV